MPKGRIRGRGSFCTNFSLKYSDQIDYLGSYRGIHEKGYGRCRLRFLFAEGYIYICILYICSVTNN